eukprot:gene23039-21057_t
MDETGAYTDEGAYRRSYWGGAYRRSYWGWMMGGGGGVDNLDWSFCQGGFEDGSLPPSRQHTPSSGGPRIRQYLRILSRFFHALDFVGMQPSAALGGLDSPSKTAPAAGVDVRALRPTHGTTATRGMTVEFVDTQRGNATAVDVQ